MMALAPIPFATHDSKQGRGGWREVSSVSELNALDPSLIREGMVVAQTNTDTIWYRKNNQWIDLKLFSFATLEEIEQLIREILEENGTGPLPELNIFRTENGIGWTTQAGVAILAERK
jgi:hypothetical protein